MNYFVRIFLKSALFLLVCNFSSTVLAINENGDNADTSNGENIGNGAQIYGAQELLDRQIQNPNGHNPDIKKVTFINYEYGKDSEGNTKINDWKNVNLEGTHFSFSKFMAADLEGTKLNKAEFFHCDMNHSKLNYAQAKESDFFQVNFDKANLCLSYLNGSRFRIVEFKGANLNGAEVKNAEFNNVDFFAAQLKNLKAEASLYSQVNFANADVSESNFERAIFSKVNFAGANLTDTKFNHAKFSEVNLYGANLENAEFNNASLEDVYCEKPENTALSETSEEIGCTYYNVLMSLFSKEYIDCDPQSLDIKISITKKSLGKGSQRNKKSLIRELSFKEKKISPPRKSLSREPSIKEENNAEKESAKDSLSKAERYNFIGRSVSGSLGKSAERMKGLGRAISGGKKDSPKRDPDARPSFANLTKINKGPKDALHNKNDSSDPSSPKEKTKRPSLFNVEFNEQTER